MAYVLRNMSIRSKMLAAYSVLVICMIALGSNAYLTISKTDIGLKSLSTVTLPKQLSVTRLKDEIVSTHVGIFRYVSWASNGINPALLAELSAEVFAGIDETSAHLAKFAEREGLRPSERDLIRSLQANWKQYEQVARDTIDVGSVDAPMATMMLGMVDDEFKGVDQDLKAFFVDVTEETRSFTGGLASEASANKRVLAVGGLLAVFVSLFVALLVTRSLVRPIQSITNLMQQVASGKLDVELGEVDRQDEIGKMVRAVAAFRETIERDNRLLKSREEELRLRNMHFHAALRNMSQGLVMFDADAHVVLFNQRYVDMYRMSRKRIDVGMSFLELLNYRRKTGINYGDTDVYAAEVLDAMRLGKTTSHFVETTDGRVMNVINRPMPGGGWVSTHEDVTERHRAEEKIAIMARQDALTALANRTSFLDEIDKAYAGLEGGEEAFAVFVLDLDQFKAVNDTLGHPIGDALLSAVADRLRDCVGDTDTVARLGGDEFAILQGAVKGEQRLAATALAKEVVKAVCGPYLLDGNEVVVSTSVGVAIAPEDGENADQLLKNADLALYKTKSEGRNGYRFFDAVMAAEMRSRRALAADLSTAISQQQLALHYQAVVDAATEQPSGVEALARWNHPSLGPVSPSVFIPLAEETGVIIELGAWLLRTACADAVSLPADMKVAVNLSPVQFRDPGLLEMIQSVLMETGLAPERLEVEVTESVLLQQNKENLGTLHALRKLGVAVVLDDFGTGYSSLSYLQDFPFDKIKIDKSFVRDLQTRADCAAIVSAVTGLARSLGVTTTAEGVETRQQFELLRAAGCNEVQGFLFSRPAPLSEQRFDQQRAVSLPDRRSGAA